MNYSELCRLKDKLLQEVSKTCPHRSEEYQDGVEEGILRLWSLAMKEMIEKDEPARSKKAA